MTGISPASLCQLRYHHPCLGLFVPTWTLWVVGRSGVPGGFEAHEPEFPGRSGEQGGFQGPQHRLELRTASPCPYAPQNPRQASAGSRPILTWLVRAFILEQTHWSGIFPVSRGGKQRSLWDPLISSYLREKHVLLPSVWARCLSCLPSKEGCWEPSR